MDTTNRITTRLSRDGYISLKRRGREINIRE